LKAQASRGTRERGLKVKWMYDNQGLNDENNHECERRSSAGRASKILQADR